MFSQMRCIQYLTACSPSVHCSHRLWGQPGKPWHQPHAQQHLGAQHGLCWWHPSVSDPLGCCCPSLCFGTWELCAGRAQLMEGLRPCARLRGTGVGYLGHTSSTPRPCPQCPPCCPPWQSLCSPCWLLTPRALGCCKAAGEPGLPACRLWGRLLLWVQVLTRAGVRKDRYRFDCSRGFMVWPSQDRRVVGALGQALVLAAAFCCGTAVPLCRTGAWGCCALFSSPASLHLCLSHWDYLSLLLLQLLSRVPNPPNAVSSVILVMRRIS